MQSSSSNRRHPGVLTLNIVAPFCEDSSTQLSAIDHGVTRNVHPTMLKPRTLSEEAVQASDVDPG